MYKTIRHGENSLQYTILPQNDDFRIEGKLSSAESRCSRRSKNKRPKRRSFFAYLGLIFVCTVIVGAVVVPFLVSAEFLPNPTEWFLKTKAALSKSLVAEVKGARPPFEHTTSHQKNFNSSALIGKSVQIINKNGEQHFILKSSKKNNSENTKNDLENILTKPSANGNSTDKLPITKPNLTIQVTTSGDEEKPLIYDYISKNDQKFSSVGSPENEKTDPLSQSNSQKPLDDEKNLLAQSNPDGIFAQSKPEDEPKDLNKNFGKSSEPPFTKSEHVVTEIRFKSLENDFSGVAPTIVVTTVRNQALDNEKINDIFDFPNKNQMKVIPMKQNSVLPTRPSGIIGTLNVNAPRAPVNTANGLNSSFALASNINTRIIQVPLLKSTKGRPYKMNSLNEAKTLEGGSKKIPEDSNEKPQEHPSKVWFGSKWPYVDPSPFFQWTGYTDENSVLLPALLGFALIGIVLIITVCIVARKKKTIVSSVRKRNRNDIEDSGQEANATLLTTSSLSDED